MGTKMTMDWLEGKCTGNPLIISLIDSHYIDSKDHLVGGLEHVYFSIHWEYIIFPTDEVIFFRGVAIPPTI